MKNNFIVTKREFSRIVKRPLEQVFSIPNVKAGVAKSVIYPFNPDAVAKHKLIPSSLHGSFSSTSDSESSSLYPSVLESPNAPSQPFSLSQSPIQLSQETTQTIVLPALPPPHTVCGTSVALHAEDAVTVASQSDTVTTSTTQTPVLSPSSVVYAPHASSSRHSAIVNPLVMAGLVPEDCQTFSAPL